MLSQSTTPIAEGHPMSARKLPIWFALALSFAGGAVAAAAEDETYDLRGPAPKKGQTFRETNKFTLKNADIRLTIGEVDFKGKMDMVALSEKEVEILGVDGRNVVKLRSKIIKDEATRNTTINGEKQKEVDTKALQGEIVFSELDKKVWKHLLEDTKPNEKQAKELKNFDDPENDDELFPAEKIKVGHAWKIEPAAFKKLLGSKFTDAKGKASSKFLRVAKVGDESCAVIESDIDLSGKIKDDDGNDITVEMKGKITSHRSIALGVDLKFIVEGTATFSGKIEQDGQKVDVRFGGKMSGEGTSTVKKR
jgi:hypothetical protein